jgi:hypothetical protein
MRKQITGSAAERSRGTSGNEPAWLPIDAIADVEITSEAPGFPIDAALAMKPDDASDPGWRAGTPGRQSIRLRFAALQSLRRIRLVFEETERARTQEFVLRWSRDGGEHVSDIVRQQFNFSPPGTPREEEEYRVVLDAVSVLELEITPDICRGDVVATLREWRIA